MLQTISSTLLNWLSFRVKCVSTQLLVLLSHSVTCTHCTKWLSICSGIKSTEHSTYQPRNELTSVRAHKDEEWYLIFSSFKNILSTGRDLVPYRG